MMGSAGLRGARRILERTLCAGQGEDDAGQGVVVSGPDKVHEGPAWVERAEDGWVSRDVVGARRAE
jgi:hypothetical protein